MRLTVPGGDGAWPRPGADPAAARAAAGRSFGGPVDVAPPGLTVED